MRNDEHYLSQSGVFSKNYGNESISILRESIKNNPIHVNTGKGLGRALDVAAWGWGAGGPARG